ncbi:hypothetical protein [uncultured Sulfitobacter sp.]|uniref:hypothetical protein n=1 Tax=uncultured Sulfitobacter sp. TaxID=191468 RepID=UPI002622A322|nr:hypothetical protein [uncultured Sulfitobacter sp.]
MTAQTPKPKNDSSEETVIGFKGSEQHHDLKDQHGEKADADHAAGDATVEKDIQDAVEDADGNGGVAGALKDAVEK